MTTLDGIAALEHCQAVLDSMRLRVREADGRPYRIFLTGAVYRAARLNRATLILLRAGLASEALIVVRALYELSMNVRYVAAGGAPTHIDLAEIDRSGTVAESYRLETERRAERFIDFMPSASIEG